MYPRVKWFRFLFLVIVERLTLYCLCSFIYCCIRWMTEDRQRLRRNSLAKSQVALKNFIARTRLRKAIIGVSFH